MIQVRCYFESMEADAFLHGKSPYLKENDKSEITKILKSLRITKLKNIL